MPYERPYRRGEGRCDQPSLDAATGLTTATCYSAPIELSPGQIEDAWHHLPDIFPESHTVGTVHHSSNLVEAGTGRLVPLSEVYLHHIFADLHTVVAEGSEHAGSRSHKELPAPYYEVVEAGRFREPASRISSLHVISTLGLPADKLRRCIECFCPQNFTTEFGALGGGACCSLEQCRGSGPNVTRTYELQYSVKYRVLEPGMAVTPVYPLIMDASGGIIEFDTTGPVTPGSSNWGLSTTGPIDARCPQTKPLQLLTCLGHLHVGGQQVRLSNSATGEVYCVSDPTYGRGPRDVAGNESDFLVAMSKEVKDKPIIIPAGTNVTFDAVYKPETHYGVMAYLYMGLVGFDLSCPGLDKPAQPGREGWSVFGPELPNEQEHAFGHYNGKPYQAWVDAERGYLSVAASLAGAGSAASSSLGPRAAGLGLLLLGVLLLGGAMAAAVLLRRRRRRFRYAHLHREGPEGPA